MPWGNSVGNILSNKAKDVLGFLAKDCLVNGNPHTVFRHLLHEVHVKGVLSIPGTAVQLGAAHEHLDSGHTSKGGRGVSQLAGSDMLTLYTSPSSLATRTLSLAAQLTRCMSKR